MNVGDKVKWKLDQADEHWAGWGVVTSIELLEPLHVLVEVHSFPDWLGPLEGKFHPLIRCAATWLTPLS